MSTTSTVRHNVGTCPGCRALLWADVRIEVAAGNPSINERGLATAYATAVIVGVSLEHSCRGAGEFE